MGAKISREEFIKRIKEICILKDFEIFKIPEVMNYDTKFDLITNEGYIFTTNYKRLMLIRDDKQEPNLFFKKNPYTRFNISLYISKNNYPYDIIEFPDNCKAITTIKVYCYKHKVYFDTNWNKIQQSDGYLCPECYKEFRGEIKKHDIEYVRNVIESYGCKLLTEEYKGVHSRLKIQCKCGNIFERHYTTIVGSGERKGYPYCKDCTENSTPIYTIDDVRVDLSNNKIELLSDKYINKKSKLKIKYMECNHIMERSYDAIRESNYICPKCNKNGYGRDTEQLKEEIYLATNGEYELMSDYKTMNDNVIIKHIKCDSEFKATPHNFLDAGTRCPHCATSKGETAISKYLTNNDIKFEIQYTFDDLKGDYDFLRFDFKVYNNNLEYLLEYDGEFHYQAVYSEDDFKRQQRYDNLKNEYCKKHNYKLIRIPYWEFDNIENILNDILIDGNENSKFITYEIIPLPIDK